MAVAVGAMLLGAAGAGAGAADAGAVPDVRTQVRVVGGNVSSPVASSRAARRVVNYWTPERMAAAKPYPVTRVSGATSGRVPSAGSTGRPMTVQPVRVGAAGPAERAATGVPRPYTNYPDRSVAKIFFVGADGGNYVCSGTIVSSANESMISTAGHCVADGSLHQWHSNWLIVPAYASKSATTDKGPYGNWVAPMATTRSNWFELGSFNEDVGFLVVKKRDRQTIVDRLGSQGIKFNQDRMQNFKDFGYPQVAPFDGKSQWRCDSPWKKDDPGYDPALGGPAPIGIKCDMTPGSSGGGWLIDLDKGLGFVNSVNSFKYTNGPLKDLATMFGPYFGSEAKALYRYTEKCTVRDCPAS
jgi:hypothetical protein